MSYIGSTPTQTAFVTDQFSGNGSTTVFTMSVGPANTAAVLVSIHGVVQDPSTYAVNGNILTFSSAPPTGTGNISCRYLGIPASAVNTTAYRTVTDFTATLAQTTFTVPSYTVGYIDVYRNGVKLGIADYTATSGTTVVLANACAAGDLVETVSLYVSSVLNAIQQYNGSSVNQILTTPTINTFGSAASNNLVLQTNGGTTAMTLDVSGNLLLGVTSNPISARLISQSTNTNIAVFDSTNTTSGGGGIRLSNSGTTELWVGYYGFPSSMGTGVTDAGIGARNNLLLDGGTAIFLGINGSEKARINSSGNLLLGTSSPTFGSGNAKISILFDGSATNGINIKTSYATNGSQFIAFYNSSDSQIGYITQNASNTVNYSTSSDYRLKENIQPMTGALATVAQLKPVTYKWKSDGSDGQGFIAHELQSVVPDCVTGQKDAVDADGNPKYQGIDTSFLVATLTAAIQELSAQVTELKAEVQALKGA